MVYRGYVVNRELFLPRNYLLIFLFSEEGYRSMEIAGKFGIEVLRQSRRKEERNWSGWE